jgi:hypothetical protein
MIFTISQVFNTGPEDILGITGAKRYYIAPYQRGYKWAAESVNDPVCILYADLAKAYENNLSEYYLQFITTKVSTINGDRVLEVIDGQQRLTTLTLLLGLINFRLRRSIPSISDGLLSYEVREKVTVFFNEHVYHNISSVLGISWSDFVAQYPSFDEQDIYFLFSALNRFDELLPKTREELIGFEGFVKNRVMIIQNNIEKNIDCEELFNNLNDNKVELVSSELIKGLLLTKSPRENNTRKSSYKEILELRAVLGRQWDEITHWTNQPEIKSFFFPESESGLDELLSLLARTIGYDQQGLAKTNQVFNYFHSLIQDGTMRATELFSRLKSLKERLNDWYSIPWLHNLLGYLLHARKANLSLVDMIPLLNLRKSEVQANLSIRVADLLPEDVSVLEYGVDNRSIFDIMLALSVFNSEVSFNFTDFAKGKAIWSLEHIFPQNPAELSNLLLEKDIAIIKSLAGQKLADFENIKGMIPETMDLTNAESTYESLRTKLAMETCELHLHEKEMVCELIRSEQLNSIGNLALLTRSDNSSNGNGMFDRKRLNIVKLVSRGSFVPKHTYDVFAKLLTEKMTPDLSIWNENDINAHQKWIQDRIAEMRSNSP